MSKETVKTLEQITWEQVRVKASKLGIPAWALAEDLTVHITESELAVVKKPSS